MLHGASNVKALTIKGCTSMHPYVPIIIADSTTPPVNLAASSRYDGCTMVQPYIKCTNTSVLSIIALRHIPSLGSDNLLGKT